MVDPDEPMCTLCGDSVWCDRTAALKVHCAACDVRYYHPACLEAHKSRECGTRGRRMVRVGYPCPRGCGKNPLGEARCRFTVHKTCTVLPPKARAEASVESFASAAGSGEDASTADDEVAGEEGAGGVEDMVAAAPAPPAAAQAAYVPPDDMVNLVPLPNKRQGDGSGLASAGEASRSCDASASAISPCAMQATMKPLRLSLREVIELPWRATQQPRPTAAPASSVARSTPSASSLSSKDPPSPRTQPAHRGRGRAAHPPRQSRPSASSSAPPTAAATPATSVAPPGKCRGTCRRQRHAARHDGDGTQRGACERGADLARRGTPQVEQLAQPVMVRPAPAQLALPVVHAPSPAAVRELLPLALTPPVPDEHVTERPWGAPVMPHEERELRELMSLLLGGA